MEERGDSNLTAPLKLHNLLKIRRAQNAPFSELAGAMYTVMYTHPHWTYINTRANNGCEIHDPDSETAHPNMAHLFKGPHE